MSSGANRIGIQMAVALTALLIATACTGKKMVLEVQGTVMYEKPAIREVTHTLTDHRLEGGAAVVAVTVEGDPGLVASFDITPGIVDLHPMQETEAGTYVGDFAFQLETVGGPFRIVGRLRHDKAGEVVQRDAETLIIPLVDRGH